MIAHNLAHHAVIGHALINTRGHIGNVAIRCRKLFLLACVDARYCRRVPYNKAVFEVLAIKLRVRASAANNFALLRLFGCYRNMLIQQRHVVKRRGRLFQFLRVTQQLVHAPGIKPQLVGIRYLAPVVAANIGFADVGYGNMHAPISIYAAHAGFV